MKDRGPAVLAGLNIGDRLVSVNGETVAGRTYAQVVQMIQKLYFHMQMLYFHIQMLYFHMQMLYFQVVQMIQKSRDSLFLVVVPRQDDILQVVSITYQFGLLILLVREYFLLMTDVIFSVFFRDRPKPGEQSSRARGSKHGPKQAALAGQCLLQLLQRVESIQLEDVRLYEGQRVRAQQGVQKKRPVHTATSQSASRRGAGC